MLFPEVWRRCAGHVAKGALLALRATVQQQDEGFKLLADEVAPLDERSLEQLRRGLARMRGSHGKAPAAGTAAAGTAGAAAVRQQQQAPAAPGAATQRPRQEPAPVADGGAAARPPADGREHKKTQSQRVFIKITAAAENAGLLEKLKAMLELHPGPLPTVLFYESTGKLLALTERYNIKPSPALFHEMEQMLGPDTVKVK
ncbi:DNA polymerase III DnaE [compost metagenome]